MTIATILSNVWYIIVAILVLLFMITVHELGHYAAGKALKFKINEFAIGMGPVIFKTKPKSPDKEVFSLRMLPLGGFCAFEDEDKSSESRGAFNNQKPWKRIVVLLSGVAMNFVASLLIAAVVFLAAGMNLPDVRTVYPNASSGGAAAEHMLQEGDVILSVNGRTVLLTTDLSDAVAKTKVGDTVSVTVIRGGERIPVIKNGEQTGVNIRGGERMTLDIQKRVYTDNTLDEDGNPATAEGVGISYNYATVKLGFFEGIGKAAQYCFRMAGVILKFFGQLVTGGIKFTDLGGPVSTIGMTAEVARAGIWPLLSIVTLIGVNLAVFNALPVPALDGARVVFVVIEWIRGKPVNRELEGKIHFIGLIVLFAFVIVADIVHLIV